MSAQHFHWYWDVILFCFFSSSMLAHLLSIVEHILSPLMIVLSNKTKHFLASKNCHLLQPMRPWTSWSPWPRAPHSWGWIRGLAAGLEPHSRGELCPSRPWNKYFGKYSEYFWDIFLVSDLRIVVLEDAGNTGFSTCSCRNYCRCTSHCPSAENMKKFIFFCLFVCLFVFSSPENESTFFCLSISCKYKLNSVVCLWHSWLSLCCKHRVQSFSFSI